MGLNEELLFTGEMREFYLRGVQKLGTRCVVLSYNLCFVCFDEKKQPLCSKCSALRTSLGSVLDCVASSLEVEESLRRLVRVFHT